MALISNKFENVDVAAFKLKDQPFFLTKDMICFVETVGSQKRIQLQLIYQI